MNDTGLVIVWFILMVLTGRFVFWPIIKIVVKLGFFAALGFFFFLLLAIGIIIVGVLQSTS